MKKIPALLLTALLILSLSACGGENSGAKASPANTAVTAIEATADSVYQDVKENEAKAMQNTYQVTGEIDEIKADHCKIDNLLVYLPSDTLANLSQGQTITFVGSISGTKEETTSMGAGTQTVLYIEFSNATLVEG